jgi:hypothetical protein
MAFYAAALLIERLGLVLLQREARVRREKVSVLIVSLLLLSVWGVCCGAKHAREAVCMACAVVLNCGVGDGADLLLLLLLQMRSGLAKKDVTAAAASRKLAAAAAQHEWLLFLLNAVNVGASLLLPCGMVLHNKVCTVYHHHMAISARMPPASRPIQAERE